MSLRDVSTHSEHAMEERERKKVDACIMDVEYELSIFPTSK
jgi:hypothetical protein